MSYCKRRNQTTPGLPESFNVLVKELQSLALDIELKPETTEQTELGLFNPKKPGFKVWKG